MSFKNVKTTIIRIYKVTTAFAIHPLTRTIELARREITLPYRYVKPASTCISSYTYIGVNILVTKYWVKAGYLLH